MLASRKLSGVALSDLGDEYQCSIFHFFAGWNKWIAKDEMGFSLEYFDFDYGMSPNMTLADNPWLDHAEINAALYNGNIRAMSTSLRYHMYDAPVPMDNGKPNTFEFSYDQLQRIKKARHRGWNAQGDLLAADGKWASDYSYDANGNITELSRNNGNGSAFDALQYHYGYKHDNDFEENYGAVVAEETNQLWYVDDEYMQNVNYDIDDQQPGNYVYDRIGNLISDVSEGIAAIEWTTTGKVAKITRVTGSDKPDLEFWYDASGQRVAKIVKPRPAGQPSVRKAWTITWYVRDASGNVLSTYEERIDDDAECPDCNLTGDCLQIIWSEAHIYGAERLGMQGQNIVVARAKVEYEGNNLQYVVDCPILATPHLHRVVGMKHYEQTDHLGNVLVVHTDKRIAVTNGQGQVLSYRAEVVTITDYYPFGMALAERTVTSTEGYRYGFNGQEKETEITGSASHTSAEFWMYDSRLGRRWNVDPKALFDVSPYSCFLNNPIFFNDIKGDTAVVPKAVQNEEGYRLMEREWEEQTGLNIYVNDDNVLKYTRTWSSECDCYVPLVRHGNFSATAQALLIQLINDQLDRVTIATSHDGTYVDRETSTIYFDWIDIKNLSKNISGRSLSSKAMSYGIVSYHEMDHLLNPNNNDPPQSMNGPAAELLTGPTVDFENIIRSELTAAGQGNFGQRTAYYMRYGNRLVIPLSQYTKDYIMRTGRLHHGMAYSFKEFNLESRKERLAFRRYAQAINWALIRNTP